MNTIQPRLPTPSPQAQRGKLNADSDDAASSAAPSQGFAAAMDVAVAKPVRKTATSKAANGAAGGSKLPTAGNQVPPAPVAVSAPVATFRPSAKAAAAPADIVIAAPASAIAPAATARSAAVNATPVSGPFLPGDPDGTDQPGMLAGKNATGASAAAAAEPVDEVLPQATNFDGVEASAVVSAGAALASPVQTHAIRERTDSAIAAKLPAGPIAGNAGAQAGGNNAAPMGAATSDGPATAADPAAPASALGDDIVSVQAVASQTSAAPSSSAVAAAASGFTAQVATAGTPPPEMGPDAATVVGAAASATTAAAADAAQATQLASTAAADKHSRVGVNASIVSSAGADGTAAAVQAATDTATTSRTDAAPAPTFKVGASVDSSDFGQDVANQVATMLGSNVGSARLQVNPPALGPIEVRIAVQGGHAQVLMMSHSAVTRDALQTSIPTLREMLGEQGFGQVSVDISQRSFQDRTPSAQTYEWNSSGERDDHPAATSSIGSAARTGSGSLDAYA